MAAPPPLPGVTLTRTPRDWQVLQRREDGRAAIDLEGTYAGAPAEFRVEARVVREADGRPVSADLDWTAARVTPPNHWSLRLDDVPAGGLYRVETRLWRARCPDTRPMRGDYVHHLGVGDVYAIAGQSNASGTGTGFVQDPPTLGVHLFGNDERWRLATHPLEDARHTRHPVTVHGVFHAHSPWVAFGRRLLAETGIPVGLIPTALGGSPIRLWEPEAGVLYANMLEMVRASKGTADGPALRCVLWYQGESDVLGGTLEEYASRFATFVRRLREDVGTPALPVLTGQLARFFSPAADADLDRRWSALREIQRRAAREVPGVGVIPTADLPMCDEIHLSAAANVALGERFAQEALRRVHRQRVPPAGIDLLGARYEATPGPRVVLTFDDAPAGWVRAGEGCDFRVEDGAGEVPVRSVETEDRGVVIVHLSRVPRGEATVHGHYGCAPPVVLRDRDQRAFLGFTATVLPG